MIDENIFKPFISAVQNTIHAFLDITPKATEPAPISSSLNTERDYFLDISAIIALSGINTIGSVTISFFKEEAEKLVKAILDIDEATEDQIEDTILELVNVVAGNIKAAFPNDDFDFTTPYIAKGSDNAIQLAPGFECYSINFDLENYNFFVKIAVLDDKELVGSSVVDKDTQKKTVLVVDDMQLSRKSIMKELGDEYNFIEAENGQQGIDLANKHLPDLITMDVEMPGMNGFDTSLKLRENQSTHNIPIVIITARNDINSKEKGFYVGAVEFFSKPIPRGELKNFVEDLFSAKKETLETVLLIESDMIARYNARYILKRFGYSVLEASNHKEAEKYLNREDIACIVTDLSMPYENSISTITAIKNHPIFHHIPIIVCAATSGRAILKKAFEAGANDFIRKPFIIEEYLARIRTSIQQKKSFDLIKEKNSQLHSAILSRDKYFSFIVHEFRTPINAIYGLLQVQNLSEYSNAELIEIGNMINDEMFNMRELVDSILEISKITKQKLSLNLEKIAINDLISSIEAMLRVLSKAKKLNLDLLIESNPYITADVQKLKTILINLISNAIKYTHEGSIKLTYNQTENLHVFVLTDTGIGIPKGYEEKIFKDYQRVTDKTDIRGTGIGLALVKLYIEAHKGIIKAESEGTGKGSKFTFTIPKNLEKYLKY